jgi:pimeloyl-ACP methyl ester carboxylesterase
MEHGKGEALEMVIHDIEVKPIEEDYHSVRLETSRGNVACRYYQAPGTRRAVIWVGGVGGDWDTPAQGLYPRLCQELIPERIASLRVRYRYPTELQEAILDVLAGIAYLQHGGIDAVALVGHSFGGAVVIQAAAASDVVRTVVTLATQSYGTAPAADLAPRCSILAIHGAEDQVLPPSCSVYVHRLAGEPKHLIIYAGAGHGLDEVAEEVHRAVHDWIVGRLSEVTI